MMEELKYCAAESGYLYGWIMSKLEVHENNIMFSVCFDKEELLLLSDVGKLLTDIHNHLYSKELKIDFDWNSKFKLMTLHGSTLEAVINVYSNIEKLNECREAAWAFIAACYDATSLICSQSENILVKIRIENNAIRKAISSFITIPHGRLEYFIGDTNRGQRAELIWEGTNAIDFVYEICKRCQFDPLNRKKKFWDKVNDITNKVHEQVKTFHYIKKHPLALDPIKAHPSDVGFDLHLVARVKEENGVIYYTTGIVVRPPLGYHFELVGRSSISKTGHILANCIGIIDASFFGEVLVALVKINKDAEDIKLPARLVQLIPRKTVYFECSEVKFLTDTSRQSGGFGSSNNINPSSS